MSLTPNGKSSTQATVELAREFDQLIQLLIEKAELPASLSDPENLKLEQRLESLLNRYFRALARVMPWHELEVIYNRYVEQE